MAESVDNQAYQALVELSRQGLASAKGLPAQVDITPHWSGVGFELLGQRFVAPMGEVAEMLEVPIHARIPNVQSWVRGVANVRGRLLPLFDLAAFFGDKLRGARNTRRVLVLETEDLYSGLIVDQVFGMQHFPVDSFASEAEDVPESVASFVSGSYRHAGSEWRVFSPRLLEQDARFMDVAQA
ncbi:MAG: chemotaxis protein CheW [Candidatus Pelagadaptatus aseana]|uniref:chemotaxis protein CheW n=1 Tax=Candidatus Pelagadaptatus aseana TaxID=3120508 RepID=UPI0039B1CC95